MKFGKLAAVVTITFSLAAMAVTSFVISANSDDIDSNYAVAVHDFDNAKTVSITSDNCKCTNPECHNNPETCECETCEMAFNHEYTVNPCVCDKCGDTRHDIDLDTCLCSVCGEYLHAWCYDANEIVKYTPQEEFVGMTDTEASEHAAFLESIIESKSDFNGKHYCAICGTEEEHEFVDGVCACGLYID